MQSPDSVCMACVCLFAGHSHGGGLAVEIGELVNGCSFALINMIKYLVKGKYHALYSLAAILVISRLVSESTRDVTVQEGQLRGKGKPLIFTKIK